MKKCHNGVPFTLEWFRLMPFGTIHHQDLAGLITSQTAGIVTHVECTSTEGTKQYDRRDSGIVFVHMGLRDRIVVYLKGTPSESVSK